MTLTSRTPGVNHRHDTVLRPAASVTDDTNGTHRVPTLWETTTAAPALGGGTVTRNRVGSPE